MIPGDRIKPGPYGVRNHFLERVMLQRAEEQAESRLSTAAHPPAAHTPEAKDDRRATALAKWCRMGREVNALRAKGFTKREIAAAFGKSVSTIERAVGVERTGNLDWGYR